MSQTHLIFYNSCWIVTMRISFVRSLKQEKGKGMVNEKIGMVKITTKSETNLTEKLYLGEEEINKYYKIVHDT